MHRAEGWIRFQCGSVVVRDRAQVSGGRVTSTATVQSRTGEAGAAKLCSMPDKQEQPKNDIVQKLTC